MLNSAFSKSFSNHTSEPVVTSQTLNLAWLQKLAVMLGLSTIMLVVPAIIHQQFITGPLVNASLLLACLWVGSSEAMLLGFIPSTVALASGTLPASLAAMVPFIMLSNSLYILAFTKLVKKNWWLSILAASSLKFLWLNLFSQQILTKLLPAKFISPMAVMMSWPQLATALLGGFIAYTVYQVFKTQTK